MDNAFIDRFYTLADRLRRLLTQYSDIHDMTKQEFILMQLTHQLSNTNQKVNTAVLSEMLLVSKSAVSQMINNLEERGFLIRKADKSDRRKPSVELTSDGIDVLVSAEKTLHENLSLLFNQLGRDKSLLFLSLFEELLDFCDTSSDIKKNIMHK